MFNLRIFLLILLGIMILIGIIMIIIIKKSKKVRIEEKFFEENDSEIKTIETDLKRHFINLILGWIFIEKDLTRSTKLRLEREVSNSFVDKNEKLTNLERIEIAKKNIKNLPETRKKLKMQINEVKSKLRVIDRENMEEDDVKETYIKILYKYYENEKLKEMRWPETIIVEFGGREKNEIDVTKKIYDETYDKIIVSKKIILEQIEYMKRKGTF